MGKGGGGGGGRGGGGGGRQGRDAGKAGAAPAQPGDETVPATYADLPNAGDMGRSVDAEGRVIVGSEGAPVLPFKMLTVDESIQKLRDAGVPNMEINLLKQQGNIQNVAMVLPENAKILGDAGYDAMGFDVGGGKVWRVQYRGNAEPLPAYDIGKYGVYADWKKKYGKVWVEQKEKLVKIGKDSSYTEQSQSVDLLTKRISAARKSTDWDFSDLHEGNWGWDSKGRLRILDPGAAVPKGAPTITGE